MMAAKEVNPVPDSKSTPTPEEPWVPPVLRTQPVDPQWALRTGLLHVVNEAVLWPIGFGLVVGQDDGGNVGLVLIEANGPVVPAIPQQEHHATHAAFTAMLAARLNPEEPSPEQQAAAEARSRIIVPGARP
jgi:hypothetical protein